MKILPCPECEGAGWAVRAGHSSSCDGSCKHCPVPIQDICDTCGGKGEIMEHLPDDCYCQKCGAEIKDELFTKGSK